MPCGVCNTEVEAPNSLAWARRLHQHLIKEHPDEYEEYFGRISVATQTIKPFTAQDLAGFIPREFILVAGHANTGKSRTVLSMASFWQVTHPGAVVYCLDTEDGIRKLWKKQFPDLNNLELYLCPDMNAAVLCLEHLLPRLTEENWLACESASRLWEYSQDLGYREITGMSKSEYLSKRMADGGKGTVTPRPNDLWPIAKNAMERNFLDRLVNETRANVLLTTTLGKERPEGGGMRESKTRAAARRYLGTDVVPEGHPRIAYYPDTVVLMENEGTRYTAHLLKDRGLSLTTTIPVFQVRDFLFDLEEIRGTFM